MAKKAFGEPQVAFAAHPKRICHLWAVIQRTVFGINHLFASIKETFHNVFLAVLLGRHESDLEKLVLTLPIHFGGIGLANSLETFMREHDASTTILHNLSNAW